MFYAVMYFNLKDGVTEEELKKKVNRYFNYVQERIKGIGPFKLFSHYFFGANERTYQLWCGFEDFHTVESEREAKEDPEVAERLKELNDLIDMKTHIDELVIELLT